MISVIAALFHHQEIVTRACAELAKLGFDPADVEVLVAESGSSQPALASGSLTVTEGLLLGLMTGVLVAGAWLLVTAGGQFTTVARVLSGWAVILLGGLTGAIAGSIAGAIAGATATERPRRHMSPADVDGELLLAVHTDDQQAKLVQLILRGYGGRVYDRSERWERLPATTVAAPHGERRVLSSPEPERR